MGEYDTGKKNTVLSLPDPLGSEIDLFVKNSITYFLAEVVKIVQGIYLYR